MRMGFWLGAMAGAGAVIYMTRNNRWTVLSSVTQAADGIGKMMNNGKNMISSNFQQSGTTGTQNAARSSASGNTTASASDGNSGNLKKVKEMAKQDPDVKAAVDEILAENGHGTTSTLHQ